MLFLPPCHREAQLADGGEWWAHISCLVHCTHDACLQSVTCGAGSRPPGKDPPLLASAFHTPGGLVCWPGSRATAVPSALSAFVAGLDSTQGSYLSSPSCFRGCGHLLQEECEAPLPQLSWETQWELLGREGCGQKGSRSGLFVVCVCV